MKVFSMGLALLMSGAFVLVSGCGSDDDGGGTGGSAGGGSGGSATGGGGSGGSGGSATGGGGSGGSGGGSCEDTCTVDDDCPWPVQCQCNDCGQTFGPAKKCLEGCCLSLDNCCDYACSQ